MKNTLETRLGIFVMLAVIAAFFILETVGGIDRFRRGYHVNAPFHNVQDLKVGDRVTGPHTLANAIVLCPNCRRVEVDLRMSRPSSEAA